jgi:hypothetical protein
MQDEQGNQLAGSEMSELDRLTRHFCKTLYSYTGGLETEWRSILMTSSASAIRAASTQRAVVAYGVEKGWLVARDGRDEVALTQEGRAYGATLQQRSLGIVRKFNVKTR